VSVSLSSSTEECGLYVNVIIQGEKTKVLVDTGATDTLVSTKLYEKMSETVRSNLHTVKQTIMSANGTP
jgi:predicted aspartyl protease